MEKIPYRTKGEKKFEELLKRNGVRYFPKFTLKVAPDQLFTEDKETGKWTDNKKMLLIPDFRLPDYAGFCEVITEPNTLLKRFDKLKRALSRNAKFTFYSDNGQKIIFDAIILERFGVYTNEAFFVIKEFGYEEIGMRQTKAGLSFIRKKGITPEHIGKVTRLTELEKQQIRKLYNMRISNQIGLAKTFNVSQGTISNVISEGD